MLHDIKLDDLNDVVEQNQMKHPICKQLEMILCLKYFGNKFKSFDPTPVSDSPVSNGVISTKHIKNANKMVKKSKDGFKNLMKSVNPCNTQAN